MLAKEVEQHNYRCAVRKAMCKITTNVFCPLLVEQMFGLEKFVQLLLSRPFWDSVFASNVSEYFSRLVYFHVMISTFEHHQNSL